MNFPENTKRTIFEMPTIIKPPSVPAVYKILYERFGPRGWWPVAKPGGKAPEYHPGRYFAKSDEERFEICVGAILTQNTSWKNVEKAMENLAGAEALSPVAVLGMPKAKLSALIRPSGYYNQKAAKLKNFSRFIIKKNKKLGRYFGLAVDLLREELLSVNGIGPETADSILLYAAGKPVFVVDAYTKRIGSRLGWFKSEPYDFVQKYFSCRLNNSAELFNEYHALLVETAKNFCRKKPLCGACPLARVCGYHI